MLTAVKGYAMDYVFQQLAEALSLDGTVVTTHWQALEDVPQSKTLELPMVCVEMPMDSSQEDAAQNLKPNMPWAEDHFQERVAGEPLNPGDQFKNWPFYRGNVEQHKEQGQFSHTYMERIWPCYANRRKLQDPRPGIRYRYGDLEDLMTLLSREPFTRQAYLPIWFPEDTGAHHGERVPCTLGYHFLKRGNDLHLSYHIRSCDLFRHFKDDVYMAVRLAQWVCNQLHSHPAWQYTTPGTLIMNIASLHVFEPEREILRKRAVRDD